jgi:PAS domain S-box-containing protein
MSETIQEVFWLTSADRQQLLYVSPAFETLWGYPRERLYTYPGGHLNLIVESIHRSDHDRAVAAFSQQFHNEYKAEYRILRPDGEMRWVRSRAFAVQNQFGETWGIAGFSEDITERKRTEDILHQREQEFRALVEHSPDIIFRFDRELRYIYINPAVELATGIPPQEYLGKTYQELGIPQELLSLWEPSLQKVFQTGELDEHEFSYLTPKGWKYYQTRLFPELAADGSVASVLGICRDITKNKQTEEALRESEQRFRSVFESASVGMVLANTQGIFIETNQAFQKLFGYTPEELQSLSLIQLTHPDDRSESIKLFQELLAGQRNHFSFQKRCFRKDGYLIWVNISVSAVCDTNGSAQYVVGMIQDISDTYRESAQRKQAELDRQKAYDELEKRVAERTAELEQANALLRQEIAERQQAQEALKTQKDFLQTVIDTNPSMIFVKDREARVVLANQACANFYGTTVEDLLGKSYEKTQADLNLDQVEAQRFITQDQEVFTTQRQKFIAQEACHTPTGEMYWFQTIKKPLVSNNGQVTQVLGVSTDITERKLVEEALRESEHRYRLLIEGMNEGVIIANEDNVISYVNEKLSEMLGYSQVEIIGHSILEFLDEDNQKIVQEQRIRRGRGESGSYELELTRNDEQKLIALVSSIPILETDGGFKGSFAVVTDITTLKAVESELQQAKEQLRAVLDAVPGFVSWINSEGRYLGVNQYLANSFNLSPEAFVGKKLGFLENRSEFVQFMEQFLASAAQTDHQVVEVQVNGSIRNYLIAAQKYHRGSNTVVVGIDITKRKQAEQALQAQKDFLQTVLDTNPNKIFVKDLKGRYVLANHVTADFYGLTVEDMLGKTDGQLNPYQAEAERFVAKDQEVLTTLQQQFIPESTCRTLTGEVRCYQVIKKPIFSSNGQLSGVFGVCTDITQRKLAEEQLRQREEQLRQSDERLRIALDAARMGFWDWNLQTGEVTRSPNLERLYGWGNNTLERTCEAFLACVHPEDRDRVRQCEQCSIETGEDCDIEFRVVLPDRGIRWIESKSQVFYDETGKPVRMTGISLDISDRKQAETQIKESLREKELLLQEIHHRVKNNLQVISSLLDLQSHYIKDRVMLEVFRESCNRVKSMALVHEQLYQSRDCARINFVEYIQNLTNYLFRVYGVNSEKITLELDVDDITLNINTAIPCGLIISELVSNALKYAFPNSKEGIVKIAIDYHKDNNYLTLMVRDNGIGFSINSSINNVKSLGLQIVKVLTNQLDGTLEITHRVGTEFRISFSAPI